MIGWDVKGKVVDNSILFGRSSPKAKGKTLRTIVYALANPPGGGMANLLRRSSINIRREEGGDSGIICGL
jgi:hypothetical protein